MAMKATEAMERALSLYGDFPLMVRLHSLVRLKTCPFRRIEPYVPRGGVIYDLGCGHGLFSLFLALSSGERMIEGYDLSEEKIRIAREAGRDVPNAEFWPADILEQELGSCDSVVILDVLYLIPYAKQEKIISRCCELLRPGGLLLIKTTDKRPRWKYLWAYFQEILAVKLLRITMGHELYFRESGDFAGLLERLGFRVRVERIDRGYPYPHVMFVCTKRAGGPHRA